MGRSGRAAGDGGIAWYLLTCIQGPLQSLPYLQRVTHFNNWTVGHAHIAMLGFGGYIALGAMWHILPLVTGRPLHSNRLVSLQFGLITFGLTGFFLVLTAAGLVQGAPGTTVRRSTGCCRSWHRTMSRGRRWGSLS